MLVVYLAWELCLKCFATLDLSLRMKDLLHLLLRKQFRKISLKFSWEIYMF